MNPDNVIKKWLRLVGSTWGNTLVCDYRLPDADTRPQVEYFVYRITKMEEGNEKPISDWGKTGTTLSRTSYKQWITTVQIDLHRSQNGMVELAKCITAAKDDNPNIKKIFDSGGVALLDSTDIKNLTEIVNDDEGLKENYHHQVIVRFYENVSISFEESNEVVQEINLTLGEWDT